MNIAINYIQTATERDVICTTTRDRLVRDLPAAVAGHPLTLR